MAIQHDCYQQITPEPLSVMQSKWHRSPQSCFVVEYKNQVIAYVLAHPWYQAKAPKLDMVLPSIKQADCLYIHDMAVSPKAQGLGIANKLVAEVKNAMTLLNFNGIGLIAIQGACAFWRKHQFSPLESLPSVLTDSLASYGADAHYLYFSEPANTPS
ncbi:GNAT family N-acetyltransferase [Shewanella aestuarii]|uniref:GNAT family N-acetyltransferase n=2 Tax=Shewanella aestuarii TaxID=1028752 RepID=A0A6G9QND2_9GAMM|nr:GNAT family N-acetyltransferase [Shewanella aestuarii]QIR15349.1 GNAT family N-acetyltransferase [Shewanella aestuarii]